MSQEHTPLMQQYNAIKQQYSDTLLFFQVGDFYELFFEDAKKAASFLGIALTARGKNKGEPIPLCGVPVHAIDHYLTKLIRGGFKVAICDQLEPPRPGSVVKRGVTHVLTPGTLTDTKLLDEKSPSYLCSLSPLPDGWGLIYGELLTGQLIATMIAPSERGLESELVKFFPDEIIIPNTKKNKPFFTLLAHLGFTTTPLDVPDDLNDQMHEWVMQQFSQEIQKTVARCAAIESSLFYFYAYLAKNQPAALREFNVLNFYNPDDFLMLDAPTQRNLELIKNAHDGSGKHTLFASIDAAVTPMGSRMLKKWLQCPLLKKDAIVHRQQVVARFIQDLSLFNQLQEYLETIGDLERIIGRIILQRGQLHDYLHLAVSLTHIPHLKALVSKHQDVILLQIIAKHLYECAPLKQLLDAALNDDNTKEHRIKNGFDKKLDHLRSLVTSSHQAIAALERQEQERTGIQSLKIKYNQIQGYYLEVTKTNLNLVPDHYKRLQMLVGKERFMTSELQQLQADIMQARNEIDHVEATLFDTVKKEVTSYNGLLRKLSHALAHLDALFSLARIAYERAYVCPAFNDERIIEIKEGRHPVIERYQDHFIPNDTLLNDEQSLWIITGPNMGGKSTYLRQVALICILAQCGSYVPAAQARVPLLDRVFTRIGSGDNLAEGKSTFLVEMEETASICMQSTKQSLVILDEVGRGTSTFDGLAIAQAVVEHLFTQVGARCLFATHYHELTHLQEQFPGIVSYYAASRKTQKGILFLYKMVKGVADGSFGVEVAKLAELPPSIIERAADLLYSLTQGHPNILPAKKALPVPDQGASVLQKGHPVVEQLQRLAIEDISAREALEILWKWKQEVV